MAQLNLDELKERCTKYINELYNKGYNEVSVNIYICMYKNRLYLSRYRVTAVEMRTNKLRTLSINVKELLVYAIERWKYEHRRNEDIEWNVLVFESDGYDVEDHTKMNQKVLARANADAHDGIMMKGARFLSRMINEHIVANIKHVEKKEKKSNQPSEIMNKETYKSFVKKKKDDDYDWIKND